jgi:hypothetical protein
MLKLSNLHFQLEIAARQIPISRQEMKIQLTGCLLTHGFRKLRKNTNIDLQQINGLADDEKRFPRVRKSYGFQTFQ